MKHIKCLHCGYAWKTKSAMLYVTCPSCLKKIVQWVPKDYRYRRKAG